MTDCPELWQSRENQFGAALRQQSGLAPPTRLPALVPVGLGLSLRGLCLKVRNNYLRQNRLALTT